MRRDFDAEVSQLRTDLNSQIAGYARLCGAAGLFAASDEVTRKDWHILLSDSAWSATIPQFSVGFSVP